jgi:hypothetical protein
MRSWIRQERDAELLRICEAIRRERREYLSVSDLASIAVQRGASSFRLERRCYLSILNRRLKTPRSPLKRQLHIDVLRAAEELRRARPGLSRSELLHLLEQQAAPRFYLSAKSAMRIIYRAMKKNAKQ